MNSFHKSSQYIIVYCYKNNCNYLYGNYLRNVALSITMLEIKLFPVLYLGKYVMISILPHFTAYHILIRQVFPAALFNCSHFDELFSL